ncbi:hypothetical protein MGN70_009604 [Eutypa lata]|nr:hypothetical protein MGN70_009604 [Eutypa lata]
MVSAVTADITEKGEVPTSQRPSLILIPWDPDSPEHVDRLVQQRIACGWKKEYVENWQDQQREGKIGLHWLVLPLDDERTALLVQKHMSAFPREAKELGNTCKSIFSRPTSDPAMSTFVPIGHISLDAWTGDEKLDTSPAKGIYSLTTFYISKVLQGAGLGGTALRMCEEMAARDFGATTITLSTIANEEMRQDSPRIKALNRTIPQAGTRPFDLLNGNN